MRPPSRSFAQTAALAGHASPWLLGIALAAACSPSPPQLVAPASSSSAGMGAAPLGDAGTTPGQVASDAASPVPDAAPPPSSKYAPCEAPPKGMVCIPGGPAVIGADDQDANEQPRHTVEISTFYIDRHEITNADYEPCLRAGACPKRRPLQPALTADQLPMIMPTWKAARAYCGWAGKRLPSEAEWEKAARGGEEARPYPWGDEPATCDRAHVQGCTPNTPKPVGSFAPGPYGIHDMAGNGYEWVNDWKSPCYADCERACGAACTEPDPVGPCGGAPYCQGRFQHVLKGGSWAFPGTETRGSQRRFEQTDSRVHMLSARCASSRAQLSTWPPTILTKKRATPPDPTPPTPQQLELFRNVVDDTDVLDLPPCPRPGTGGKHCRDPFNYVTSNEPHQHRWVPYIENLGGGYAGVGADQSFNFIALARSQWAWLFDYDPTVARLHQILRVAILASATPHEFVDLFRDVRRPELEQALDAALPPEERKAARTLVRSFRNILHVAYFKAAKPSSKAVGFGWLRNPDHYRYVRLLYQQGRILSIKGNLLTNAALFSIASSAKALGVPIRLFYMSNAEDHWMMSEPYRNNIRALPFDDQSIVLRTSTPRFRKAKARLPYRYAVHWGPDLQDKLRRDGWEWAFWFVRYEAHHDKTNDVYAIRLPGPTEREPN